MTKLAANFGKRRAMAAVATAAAAAAAVSLAVPAMAAPTAPAGRMLSAGQTGTRAQVPWRHVGPGWTLAMYSASQGGEGIKARAGASTLYLVDPGGGRYRLVTWPAHSPKAQWYLLDWSGDVSRALFTSEYAFSSTGAPEHLYQLQLKTGHITGFTLPPHVAAVGYTRPAGLNILAEKGTPTTIDSKITLQRYSLTGKLQQNLTTVAGLSKVAYAPDGTALAAGGLHGLLLISNAGGVIRNLPVPGAQFGCSAVRWWSASTILASCSVPNEPGPRLWLVPAGGAKPAGLTPARTGSSFDAGDFNAWQLSSGLYVNGLGACGTLVIGRQPAHGPEELVNVPGSASSLIVNATRSQLLVERINGCSPGISLVWFNPSTRKMTVAIGVGRNQHGVSGAVPYFVAGKF